VSLDIKDWTVLIVDDEGDNLGVAQKVLSYGGAEVHIARNGIEGLEVLESVKPTFILLDLSMPEMDGWEMAKRVRADEKLAMIPIIALTAHAMSGDKERVLGSGFDGYIAKPFRINSFMEEILASLRQFGKKDDD
jgi:two-component system, cell cycle response regulator DivK